MQQVLGSGAQATVYQAVAKKSNRKTAVKVRRRPTGRRAHGCGRRARGRARGRLRRRTSRDGARGGRQVLDQKELEDDDLFDALRMEIMILKQLKHP